MIVINISLVKGKVLQIINAVLLIFGFELHRKALYGVKNLEHRTHLKKEYLLPLTPDSLFIDIGCYLGEETQAIWEEYHCNIISFEPALRAFKTLEAKFIYINKIKLERLAAGDQSGRTCLYHTEKNDGNSLYRNLVGSMDDTTVQSEEIETIDFSTYLDQNNITSVDLLKLNCEGGEWKIFRSIIRDGKLGIIKQIIVQWHASATVPDEKESVLRELNVTHSPFKFHPAWEIWTRK